MVLVGGLEHLDYFSIVYIYIMYIYIYDIWDNPNPSEVFEHRLIWERRKELVVFVRISLTGHGNIIHIVITTGLWPMEFFPFGCEFRYKTMQGDENLQIGNLTSIGWFLLCKVSYHESSWSVDSGKTQTCRTRNQQIWGLSWEKIGLPLGDLTTRLRVKYILTSSDTTDRHQWRLCLLRPSKQLENWVILPCNIPIIWNFYLYLWALGVSRIVQVESRESSQKYLSLSREQFHSETKQNGRSDFLFRPEV